MINLKELHTDDLSMNSGKLFREQMIDNFKAIQQEFDDLRGEIDSEEQDRKSEDTKLNGRIDDTNTRLDNLDKQKATHDEVKAAKDEWKNKIEHVALGTDYATVEKAVEQILQEKGLI
ncbi:hypothetical protein LRLP16767_LR202_02032 [Limosilactobacillus reuteri]|uniref:Uncharacterized protein n=1 Tax=Limosilactobacillus reuteri TaxID=1598 RepID=A0A0U5JWP6_LIMRT|nr:hypothetical protein LRLP16767_LR202_02032 [Limosilactobacillus reuteri]